MPQGSFEKIEHTADIGLRLKAQTLDDLFRVAARGLNALWGIEPRTHPPSEPQPVTVRGPDTDALLVAWLNELIYQSAAEGRIAAAVHDTTVRDQEFTANVEWNSVDWNESRNGLDVKAATFHGLHVIHEGPMWTATVIFDV